MFYLPFFKAQRWYFETNIKECLPKRYLNRHQMAIVNKGREISEYDFNPVFEDKHIDYQRICDYFDTYLVAFGLSVNKGLVEQHVHMYTKVWKKTALTERI